MSTTLSEDARGYEIVALPSGVRAMRDRVSGEVMHCGTGPLVESQELYVRPSRLAARLEESGDPLVLFDVGLGAASNAIAAWQVSEARTGSDFRRLEIVSFENDLSSLDLALQADNGAWFGLERSAHAAASALLAHGRFETERTLWRLSLGELPVLLAREPEASGDIVFWDMYSSRTCPELWHVKSFRQVRRHCREHATLHTYSASTSTRSSLLLAGFSVGVGVRTGDRDESTMAAVTTSDLERPLDAAWLGRLARSSVPFPKDIGTDPDSRGAALEQVRVHPQFFKAR